MYILLTHIHIYMTKKPYGKTESSFGCHLERTD